MSCQRLDSTISPSYVEYAKTCSGDEPHKKTVSSVSVWIRCVQVYIKSS